MKKEIYIINGIPGSGKTTTAKTLAKTFSRATHIEGDSIQDLIVSGKVSPGQEPQEEESKQIHLCVKNQCLLARSFAESGFVAVIDYVVVDKERVEEYRNFLKEFDVYLITLNPGIETALYRDKSRPEKTVAEMWVHLDKVIKEDLNEVGLWIDNSNITIEEAVGSILKNKEKGRIN